MTTPHSKSSVATKPAAAPRAAIDWPASLDPLAPPASFTEAAQAAGIEFDQGDLRKLGEYLAWLLHANELMNLTAIREPGEAWTRHILDALSLLPLLEDVSTVAEGERLKLIDVGTGGGVPGLPLAIVAPHIDVTLLDATGKKVEFLRHVVERLKLPNALALQGRAETLGHDRGTLNADKSRAGGHRESYDIVTARAVGRVNILAELCVPLAKVGGRIILIKGAKAEEELAEAKQALHKLHAEHLATIDTPTGKVVVIEKKRSSPKVYPRPSGEPAKHPL